MIMHRIVRLPVRAAVLRLRGDQAEVEAVVTGDNDKALLKGFSKLGGSKNCPPTTPR
jgi:hypothetical protein